MLSKVYEILSWPEQSFLFYKGSLVLLYLFCFLRVMYFYLYVISISVCCTFSYSNTHFWLRLILLFRYCQRIRREFYPFHPLELLCIFSFPMPIPRLLIFLHTSLLVGCRLDISIHLFAGILTAAKVGFSQSLTLYCST
jgi:hypothetical protein